MELGTSGPEGGEGRGDGRMSGFHRRPLTFPGAQGSCVLASSSLRLLASLCLTRPVGSSSFKFLPHKNLLQFSEPLRGRAVLGDVSARSFPPSRLCGAHGGPVREVGAGGRALPQVPLGD